LVSYLGQPILLHNKETVELLDNVNHEINKSIYLIDTKIQRSTAALVEAYQLTRRENEEFIMQMQIIAEINDELIDSYLLDDRTRFAKKMKELSEYQYNTMKMLIPEKYSSMWKKGLETGEYSMKINGAGGGGFLMVMKHDQSCLSDQDLIPIV
jgi:mevalonate kinase